MAVILLGIEGYGVESVLLSQHRMAGAVGLDYRYFSLSDGPMAERLRRRGAEVETPQQEIGERGLRPDHSAVGRWLRWGRGSWSMYREVVSYLERTSPDRVYTHAYYTHMIGGRAAKRMGIPSLGHVHGTLNARRAWGQQRVALSTMMDQSLDQIIVLSHHARGSLWGPARNRAVVLPNGIDVESISGTVEGVKKRAGQLAVVGRIVAIKQIDVSIRACRILVDEGHDVFLDVVGGDADDSNVTYRTLKTLVGHLGLTDRVRFTGPVSSPYPLMARAQVLISCCPREGFGLTVVEAMACGTAVVVADAGATAELVRHGESGVIFPTGDHAALARALGGLLRDETRRSHMTEKARVAARRRYDLSRHMAGLAVICGAAPPHDGRP